ncbi:MAG: PDZ domain-containing protein [Candidatus Cloacimonetes bacterium]|jgi:membrane-associated protease RseP (regulator of RpoE activity)|nr:PDZ domain-containing protein [Candidatus Cloacimonadota bacterium]
MAKIMCVGLCLSLLWGCANLTPLETRTGRPDIVINGVTKKEVSDVLVNFMINYDFLMIRMDEYSLVFGKIIKDPGMAILGGSRYDPFPQNRWTYTLIDATSGIRVLTTIEIVTNPGSAFEQKTDVSKASKAAHEAQTILENLKRNLEFSASMKDRGKVGVQVENKKILYILPGSPAEKAGLRKDDIILKVDGADLTGDIIQDSMMISGEPGVTVIFLINRNGEELIVPVIRGNP